MDVTKKLITFPVKPEEENMEKSENKIIDVCELDSLNEDSPDFVDFKALSNRGIDIFLPLPQQSEDDDDVEEIKPIISTVEVVDSEDETDELPKTHSINFQDYIVHINPNQNDAEMDTSVSDTSEIRKIHADENYKKMKEKCNCVNCSSGKNPGKIFGHLCGVCNKSYKKTSHYRYHQMLHTNERISCSYCGKLFHRPDMFKRHLRIHLGERNFECEKCGKKFFRSDHLKKHANTHLKNSV